MTLNPSFTYDNLMTQPLTLIKLIILYMLSRVDFPLRKVQIFDFILDKDYTNYFTLQQATGELTESRLIEIKTINGSSHVFILDEGRTTLDMFSDRLSAGIKDDIDNYFKEKEFELKNDLSVTADCYRSRRGRYIADMSVKDSDNEIIRLKVALPTMEAAQAMCSSWSLKSQEIYNHVIDELI